MATPTTRRRPLPCVSDSTTFASSSSLAALSRNGRSHARTTSVPLAPFQPSQQGHHRSRSWLPSFLKSHAAPTPPPKTVEAPAAAAPPTPNSSTRPTPRRRSKSLGASLRRKVKNLSLSTANENLPAPPRPAPPTLIPDADMLDLRLPKAPTNPHHFSLPYGALSSRAERARNCSWDWDGGEGNLSHSTSRKGHTRGAQSLDAGSQGGPRLARTRDGRIADLGSIWENFVEENDEGEVISFDLPPLPEANERKGSVSTRRVPVPTYIPFPSNITSGDSIDPLDISAHVNPDSSMANTSASHFDLSSFPNPDGTGQFEDERPDTEDEDAYVKWNTSAIIPSRQSSLASRRARPLPSPLIIESEPASAFDEPTPSPTDSNSVYSREDETMAQQPPTQHRASYFSPISPNSPDTPASSHSAYSDLASSSAGADQEEQTARPSDSRPISPLSPLPLPPRRSPILDGLAISSSGLLPDHTRHRKTPSSASPLALKTMKTLPLLPLDDEADSKTSHLSNALPFAHTSFLSPFTADYSPQRNAPSPATSPRTRPSPPRIAFGSPPFLARNLSSSYGSSLGLSSEIDQHEAWAREARLSLSGEEEAPTGSTPYNPSPQLPTSSTFTATTRFGNDLSPYQASLTSFDTRASSVLSEDLEDRRRLAMKVVDDEEGRKSDEEEEESDDEENEEADSSRIRGEKWIQRELVGGEWGGEVPSEYDDEEEQEERIYHDEPEGEETIKVDAYCRREQDRREDERAIRYAKERRSLYNEPGPDEALYVYGVAL